MKTSQVDEIEMAVTIMLTREIVALVTAKEGIKLALENTYNLPSWEAKGFVDNFVAEAEKKLVPIIRKHPTTSADYLVEQTFTDAEVTKEAIAKHPLEDLFQHYLEGGK